MGFPLRRFARCENDLGWLVKAHKKTKTPKQSSVILMRKHGNPLNRKVSFSPTGWESPKPTLLHFIFCLSMKFPPLAKMTCFFSQNAPKNKKTRVAPNFLNIYQLNVSIGDGDGLAI